MRNLDIRITLVCDTHPIHVRKVLKVKYIFYSMMFEKIDDYYVDDDNVNDLIYCYRARYHPDGKTSTLNWRPEHQDTM